MSRLLELPWKLILKWWLVLYALQAVAIVLGASWLVLVALTALVLYVIYLSL